MEDRLALLWSSRVRTESLLEEALRNGAVNLAERMANRLENIDSQIDSLNKARALKIV